MVARFAALLKMAWPAAYVDDADGRIASLFLAGVACHTALTTPRTASRQHPPKKEHWLFPHPLDMATREIFGLALIAIALVLTPLAWLSSRVLWFVAFAMFVSGVALFFTERVMRRISKSEGNGYGSASSSGQAMPTDIHNYTGWRSGGRSETMDSPSNTGDGGDA